MKPKQPRQIEANLLCLASSIRARVKKHMLTKRQQTFPVYGLSPNSTGRVQPSSAAPEVSKKGYGSPSVNWIRMHCIDTLSAFNPRSSCLSLLVVVATRLNVSGPDILPLSLCPISTNLECMSPRFAGTLDKLTPLFQLSQILSVTLSYALRVCQSAAGRIGGGWG